MCRTKICLGSTLEQRALVMPTFFGPTNIPILEAWAFGCPVLTSDIRGIREQVGDAAVLVNPRSVEAIADGIYRLWTDENLGRMLGERGGNAWQPTARTITVATDRNTGRGESPRRSEKPRDSKLAQLSECADPSWNTLNTSRMRGPLLHTTRARINQHKAVSGEGTVHGDCQKYSQDAS